jgi:hypothetical protein
VVGRGGHRGQRLGLRLPAPTDRPARHLPDRDGHAGRRGRGLLPARPEPRGRRTAGCNGWACRISSGWWCATST